MTPEAETPKIDLAAGLVSKPKKAAPQIDLAAGLVSKPRKASPKVDLNAGLVSKGKAASLPVGSPSGVKTPSAPPAEDSVPTATRATRLRPPSVAASSRPGQAGHPGFSGNRIELPAVTPPAVAAQESAPPSPVIPAPAVSAPVAPVFPAQTIPEMHAVPPFAPRVQMPPVELRSRVEATRQPVPMPPRGREPQRATVPLPAAAAAPPFIPEAAPAQSWERLASRPASSQPQPAPEVVHHPEPEETQHNAATRMTGLKNLIFTLGQKNLYQVRETAERPFDRPAAAPPPPVEPLRQRPVYPRASAPIPQNSPRREPEMPSPTLVTAPPEFLPPKPMVERTEKEHGPSGHSTSRRDRRETYDDVEILPSWRGQYKKKG